jgi:hypothetical protein
MPRLPGSPSGSGMGGFLSGAGEALGDKVANIGGSLLSAKIGHDMDMAKLDKQLDARAEENARSDEAANWRAVLATGDLEIMDRYIHNSTDHKIPSVAENYQNLDTVFHEPADKQRKARGYINTLMTADDPGERITAKTNLEAVRSGISNPKTLQMIDQALAQKDLGTMLLANEMLTTYKEYIPTDTYKRLSAIVKHTPGAVVNILPTIITDRNARLALYKQILDDNNRSQMVEAIGPDAIDYIEKDWRKLLKLPSERPKNGDDDPDDIPGFATEDEAIKEFMMRDPAAGWITNKKYKEGQIPDWRDVNQFKGHTVGDDKMFDVSQRDGRWFVSSVGAKPPPPSFKYSTTPPADDDDEVVVDEEPFARKKGRLETFIEGAVEPDEGRDSKLDQYATRKTWKDTSNPGSVLRFRYNKNEGSYQVKDATRSEVDVYGKKEWQSISKEQFHEIVKNLVQWGR